MSNKKLGSDFEQEVCEILANKGYWAMKIPDDKNGQPFDIIAGKDNQIFAIECKTCDSRFFNISRIEVNQRYAFEAFGNANNDYAYFVFKYNGKNYITNADIILSQKTPIDVTMLYVLEYYL